MKKIFFLLCFVAIIAGGLGYYAVFMPNVKNSEPFNLFIPSNATFQTVLDSLKANNILDNEVSFTLTCDRMNYGKKIYAGRYVITPKSSNRALVTMLRTGKQTPYKLTINNIRTKKELIQQVDSVLEASYTELESLLNNDVFLQKKGFSSSNIISAFMADTYQVNWNTSAEDFLERMLKEYEKFWTKEQKEKANALNLSPLQVVTLASIVEEETIKVDEAPIIAGVYLNRLRIQMPLQADPTVKFAVGDFSLKRILKTHLDIESPYNTYKYAGLPPGPIRIPAKKYVESVLNAEKSNYLYFCAKADFSGYHDFAVTYNEHLINARNYQNELNRRKIN